MEVRLNMITAGATTFRYLAYAGAAGGILGIITAPAESVALVMLALAACGLMAALMLIIFAVCRPHMSGELPALGRPTRTHAKILLLAVLLPLSEGWSFGFFFFVSIGLILSGLTFLVGLALRPVNAEDEEPNRGSEYPDQTPAGRFGRAFGRVLEKSRPPLPNLTPGEVAAHADLFGRNGKIRVDLKAQTATVATTDTARHTVSVTEPGLVAPEQGGSKHPASQPAGTAAKGERTTSSFSPREHPLAAEFRMTEDDAAGPDASLAEDLLELRLLTAEDQGLGPVDFPVKDHRLDELQIEDEH